ILESRRAQRLLSSALHCPRGRQSFSITRLSRDDPHEGRAPGGDAHADISRKRGIYSGIAGIGAQEIIFAETHDLALGSEQNDVVAADGADRLRRDLLVAAAEDEALAADHAEDDRGGPLRDQLLERPAVEIARDKGAVKHGVDPEQSALESEMMEHAHRRG